MDDQVKRIKSSNFNNLDDRLFATISKADNLNSTLSQLSQLQNFLLGQIKIIETKNPTEKPQQVSQKIHKNYESMKESILRQTSEQINIDWTTVNDGIRRMKEEITKMKQIVQTSILNLNKQAQNGMLTLKHRIIAITKEANSLKRQNQQLKIQNQHLKKIVEENQSLKIEIQTLKRQNKREQRLQSARLGQYKKPNQNLVLATAYIKTDHKQSQYSSFRQKLDLSAKMQKNSISVDVPSFFSTCSNNPQIPTLLKRQPSSFSSALTEITSNANASDNNQHSYHSSANLRRKSNHQIKSKEKCKMEDDPQQEKEAAMMKVKGVEGGRRGSSKQKLKIFSLM